MRASLASPGSLTDDCFCRQELHQQEAFEGGNPLQCCVTLHRAKEAKTRDEFHVGELSIHDFVAFLKKQASAFQDSKDDLTLFNSSVFEPPRGAEGYRRQDYFRRSSFLVLDFDNGELSPEQFIGIFWSKARRGQKRSFLICNSLSRSLQQPNRFRVIMFYKRPATSIGQHEAILADVIRRLELNGFPDARTGSIRIANRAFSRSTCPGRTGSIRSLAFFEDIRPEDARARAMRH